MKVGIWAYNPHSESAKVLAEALDIPRLKHSGSSFKGDAILNWGAAEQSGAPNVDRVFNWYQHVSQSVNKLQCFYALNDYGVPVPDFTEDIDTVHSWLNDDDIVVCRRLTRGHSGDGIIILDPTSEKVLDIPKCPLYTKYVKKKYEFRVHVVKIDDEYRIIDVQRKIRDPSREVENWFVRSWQNGFIFARNGVEESVPEAVKKTAIKAVESMCLDFGAVDIIYNEKKDAPYVLEINTAPGLEGETITKYAEAFREMLHL